MNTAKQSDKAVAPRAGNPVEDPDKAFFTIEKVFTIHQECSVNDRGDDLPSSVEDATTYSWNWRFVSQGMVEVYFAATLSPSQDSSLHVEVGSVVQLRLHVQFPLADLKLLVTQAGPGILIPIVRERISSLTAMSGLGHYLLQPIPLGGLREALDFEDTLGWRQLNDDPSLPSPPSGPEGADES